MNKQLKYNKINVRNLTVLSAIGTACLILSPGNASAQTTIALDTASDPAYSGGDFDTGYNGGYGFSPWTLNTPGGGHYVGGGLFGLWNNAYGTGTGSYANRSFASPLSTGETFSISLQNGSLNGSYEQEGINLEDASGNVLFSFWQQGGNYLNGNYSDANGAGTATGFAYNYSQLDNYAFTLNSPTSYTFTDLATASSITGTVSGTIDQVQIFRDNLAGDPNTGGGGGTDYRFNNLQVVVPEPSVLALGCIGGFGMFSALRRRIF